MTKLVVFDWNGCLLADLAAIKYADDIIFHMLGHKPISIKQYRDTLTIPAIDFLIANGISKEVAKKKQKQITEIFHKEYEKRAKKCRTRAGTRKVLTWLNKHNIRCIILSNHTKVGVDAQLKRLKLSHFFTDVITNTAGHTAYVETNKVRKLRAYMKKHRYNAKDVIIVGDSPEEIEIGHELNITSVTITGGYYATNRLKKLKPHHLIHKLDDLIPIVKFKS